MATPIVAANAYASLAAPRPIRRGARPRRAGEAPADRASARCSRTRSARSVEAGRKSDAQAQAMAAGKANIVDVVTAVAETEVAIEALVVGARQGDPAYEEIMRMPI